MLTSKYYQVVRTFAIDYIRISRGVKPSGFVRELVNSRGTPDTPVARLKFLRSQDGLASLPNDADLTLVSFLQQRSLVFDRIYTGF
jgi:hypothetical protein